VIICGRVRVSGKLFVRVIQPKLPKFVKVTAKILSVFFSGHGVFACTPKLFGGGWEGGDVKILCSNPPKATSLRLSDSTFSELQRVKICQRLICRR